MASIYELAHFTIAGASSADGLEGLFRESQTYESMEVINAHSFLDGPRVELRRHLKSRLTSPLISRGWIFQESQLSRRFIYFAPNEVTWDCFGKSCCESDRNHLEWSVFRLFPRMEKGTPSAYTPWHEVVMNFTKMALTKPDDRLPALAGLASRFHWHRPNMTYAAGLWLEELGRGTLFWWSMEQAASRPSQLYPAPAWSWASINNEVRFPMEALQRCYPPIFIHEYDYIPVEGGNEYGLLRQAHLRLSGFVASGTILSHNYQSTQNNYLGDQPMSQVRVDGVEETLAFLPDYQLAAKSKHQVMLGTEVFLLFGYFRRHYAEDGEWCGSDSSDDEGDTERSTINTKSSVENTQGLWAKRLHTGRSPAGIVTRCIDLQAGQFERIGLFDAMECSNDVYVQFELGKANLQALRKAVQREIILV